MKKLLTLTLLGIINTTNIFATKEELHSISSPSNDLYLTAGTDESGTPVYSLKYKGRDVVKTGKLGLKGEVVNVPTLNGLAGTPADFTGGFTIASIDTTSIDRNWQPVWGQYDNIRDNFNELALTFALEANPERKMIVRFRLFDDGLGFRYELPKQQGLDRWAATKELTEFNLPGNPTLYCSPGNYDNDEYLYTTTPMSDLKKAFDRANYMAYAESNIPGLAVQTPLMIKTEDSKPLYINIHEAALRNYGALSLDADPANSQLRSHITPDRTGIIGWTKLPFQTPWRTIIVSDDARDILASSLILNLNEPCSFEDTSWIKPTKFMGVWWEYFLHDGGTWAYSDDHTAQPDVTDYTKVAPNGRHRANNENVRKYIDFASEHEFPALLVEGWNEGWEDWGAYGKNHHFRFDRPYPDFDIDSLNAYAKSKGVQIIMHHETAGNASDYERQLDTALKYMNDHGYSAVKTGYVGHIIPRNEHHSSQWMNDHYAYVAERAAEHKIMVDSHEAVRPTGLCRTYPNWIAQESARGGEYESMGGNTPEHTTLLPFLRLMGGPMDYTPGLFEPHVTHVANGGKVPGSSTIAKQLGLYLTMPSPLQMACDLPKNYEKRLDAFQFIKDVPVDWRDSRYLEAEPGDYITVARLDKNSDNWYVGGITDENPRKTKVDLSFLTPGVTYEATIYADGKDADCVNNPTSYAITNRKVNSKTRLNLDLARGGGFAISLKPISSK